MPATLNTPVAIFIFNRPETTRRLMAAVAKVQPSTLLVVADGPRKDHIEDREQCRLAREATECVDWRCDRRIHFSPTNIGNARRVVTGLDWVFSQCSEAIILEDDCLPHPTFFPFCEHLLERFREDERIAMISGNNFEPPGLSYYSYSFTRYIGIWGWATWARSWRHLDFELQQWRELRQTGWLEDVLGDRKAAAYWSYILDLAAAGRYPSWDYQWMFSCWVQNGFNIIPKRNLVSNIGYGKKATNTTRSEPLCDSLPTYEMQLPLRHPNLIVRNRKADEYLSRHIFRCYRWLYGGKLERIAARILSRSKRSEFSARVRDDC
jgi:hypothetical protein